jgi:hypothetical protein
MALGVPAAAGTAGTEATVALPSDGLPAAPPEWRIVLIAAATDVGMIAVYAAVLLGTATVPEMWLRLAIVAELFLIAARVPIALRTTPLGPVFTVLEQVCAVSCQ